MMKLWNIILLSIITLLSTVIDNVTAFRCPRVCVCTSHVISSDEVLKIDCHGRKLSVDILQVSKLWSKLPTEVYLWADVSIGLYDYAANA